MALTFDHATQRILISSPQTSISVQEIVDACREEEASALGMSDAQILSASGKDTLDTGVTVGVTAKLLDTWQLEWWPGNYTAKIGGGNLVSETGDAVAYVVGGPQVEITLSAAATIVTQGGVSPADIWSHAGRTLTAGTKDAEIDAIKALAEADEELTPTVARKKHKDTKAVLLEKTVTGSGLTSTITLVDT